MAAVTPPVRVDLTSLLTARGEPVRLGITSQAPIDRVVVRLGGAETVFDQPAETGARWDLEVPVPPGTTGGVPVEVEIAFEAGMVARRTLQVIVTGDTTDELPQAAPGAPGGRDRDQPDRRKEEAAGQGARVAEDQAQAGKALYPPDLRDLERLPGSDELLTFHAPSGVVPPGVTVAIYATSQREIAGITVTNLRHLHSSRRWSAQGRQIWRVLAISPVDAKGTLEVPVRVTFTDGLVEERVVHFTVDRFAPVPLIPGYNVPYPTAVP